MDFERYKRAYAMKRDDAEETIQRIKDYVAPLRKDDFKNWSYGGRTYGQVVDRYVVGASEQLERGIGRVYESRDNWRMAFIAALMTLIGTCVSLLWFF